jgi:leucyl aminopeptidase
MALGTRVGEEAEIAFNLTGHPEGDQPAYGAALVEGAILGSYRWSAPGAVEPAGPEIAVRVADAARDESAVRFRRAAIRARAANWARRLTDTPPSDLTPERFANLAAEVAESQGWRAANLAGDELLDAGLTGIHAVGRGSSRPAQLIDLTYSGREGDEIDVVLVGKGITMDCGGLNLKIERAMAAVMKSDVAGGAAVIATLAAVTALEVPLNVRVLIPSAENLPGPEAVLPGDVIEHFGGRTTEVALTDAEGRLVLADCLAYARVGSEGAVLIDVGTISEAPFAPAGWTVASADGPLAADIVGAANEAGEVGVHIPLVEGYEPRLASIVADSKNWDYGHTSQDLMIVPTFLAPFAGDSRWAHIDVCAVAYLYDDAWLTWPQGATGSPTRTLVQLLCDWE